VRKKVRKHDQEFVKSIITTPSFRVVPEYEDIQQKVKKRKLVMEQHRDTCQVIYLTWKFSPVLHGKSGVF